MCASEGALQKCRRLGLCRSCACRWASLCKRALAEAMCAEPGVCWLRMLTRWLTACKPHHNSPQDRAQEPCAQPCRPHKLRAQRDHKCKRRAQPPFRLEESGLCGNQQPAQEGRGQE